MESISHEKRVQVAEELEKTLNPDQLVIEGVLEVLHEEAQRRLQEEFEYDDFMNPPY